MINKHVLVLGSPGSGKSHLAAYAKKAEFPAYDADYDVPGLGVWKNSAGEIVSFPTPVSVAWLDTHQFVWDREVLVAFLRAHEAVFLFGIASNAFEMTELFDHTYYLSISETVLRERLLMGVDRKNPRGKSEEEVCQIWRDIHQDHLPEVGKRGVVIIDGSRSAEDIVKDIVDIS